MSRRRKVWLGLAASLSFSSLGYGQTTYTWNDPAGGNFHNSTNWTPSGVPGAIDRTVFTLPDTYTVTLSLNGTSSQVFEARRGHVTLQYNNTTANHTFNAVFVTPNTIDSWTSSTMTLSNMTSQPLTTTSLQVGVINGKTGTLNINNNGNLVADIALIGNFTGGIGNLNISTTGASQNSALTSQGVVIGGQGGTGIALVSGTNARLQATSYLYVGEGINLVQGSLTVSNGGSVITPDLELGISNGSSSQLRNHSISVSGTNSRIDAGTITVAQGTAVTNAANGTISVISGGTISSTGAVTFASGSASTTGALTVSGTNSLFQSTQSIVFGVDGSASVNVATGGRMLANGYVFGQNAGSSGRLLVQSLGSSVESTAGMTIGFDGTGHVDVVSNGQLSAEGSIGIGNGNSGTLNIQNGRVFSDGGRVGIGTSGVGQVTVSGLGSSWNAIGDNSLQVGVAGQGTMNINNGGSVSARAMELGNQPGSNGNVTVQGAASTLTVTEAFTIGTVAQGTGSLAINAGGKVEANTLVLYPTGSLQLNGGSLHVSNYLDQGGAFQWNSGTVNFTRTINIDDALATSLMGSSHVLRTNQILSASGGASPPVLSIVTNVTADGGRIQSDGEVFIASGQTMLLQNGSRVSSTTGLTNAGMLELKGSTTQVNGGAVTNQGVIHGTGVLNAGLINSTGLVQVTAGERLTLAAPANSNAASIQMLGGILDVKGAINNQATGFISGHGTIMTSTASPGGIGLVNSGVLALSGGNTNVFGDVEVRTGGRIITSGGSVTTFHDDVVHNGAEIRTSTGAYSVFFGQVSGAGAYTGAGTVQYEGDLRPGNSPANVTYAGNLEFSVTSKLVMELGGINPGSEHDRLTVQGTISLGGALEIDLINGYQPRAGQAFLLIDNQGSGAIGGTFTGLPEGASFTGDGQLFTISYLGGNGNDVMLVAVPEPTTRALMGLAVVGGAGYGWRRYRRQQRALEQSIP
jgi:fibronectin-binding autotransporter adhesin